MVSAATWADEHQAVQGEMRRTGNDAPGHCRLELRRVFSRCISISPDLQGVRWDRLPTPALDGQALAALGAACVDHGTATLGLHAHQETVGTGAAGLGRLVSTFHVDSLEGSVLQWLRCFE
jgi:hypothetical protein